MEQGPRTLAPHLAFQIALTTLPGPLYGTSNCRPTIARSCCVQPIRCGSLSNGVLLRLLGPSPSWYKSEAYRSRVVREPREVLREFGLELPDAMDITVWDSSAESRYMVLPRRPEGTAGLGEDELAALVTRNALIGTAAV